MGSIGSICMLEEKVANTLLESNIQFKLTFLNILQK